MFIPPARGDGHRFYQALDNLLREADFDARVEALCEPHYAAADGPGRPSLAPGIFFRMLLVGYFEGIASERGICWRCADSFSLRDFLGLATHTPVPDQTTVSRTRRRLPVAVFEEVFRLVLGIVAAKGLLKGRVRGVDSTYLQADASMKSIVRKDTGEDYAGYIRRLATEAGEAADGDAAAPAADRNEGDPPPPSEPPGGGGGAAPSGEAPSPADDASEAQAEAVPARRATREEAVRHDRKRSKRTSNREWQSRTDPESRIARMKNSTIRLAYKYEHVVDLDTGVILAAHIYQADRHDAATILESLAAAEANVAQFGQSARTTAPFAGESWHKEPLAEVVADKGYHKSETLRDLVQEGYRTFIPERKQHGRRRFTDKGGAETARAVYANRARVTRCKGKQLQRQRGELLERPNQHLYDRTGLRNLPLTGWDNVRKRAVLQSAAFNLGAVMRRLVGAGAPRALARAVLAFLAALWAILGFRARSHRFLASRPGVFCAPSPCG